MLTDNRVVVVDVGESVLFECQFYADDYNLFDYPVLWRKTQAEEDLQVNIMGNINEPFLSEERFEATFTMAVPRYNLQLSILCGSTLYVCSILQPPALNSLWVYTLRLLYTTTSNSPFYVGLYSAYALYYNF